MDILRYKIHCILQEALVILGWCSVYAHSYSKSECICQSIACIRVCYDRNFLPWKPEDENSERSLISGLSSAIVRIHPLPESTVTIHDIVSNISSCKHNRREEVYGMHKGAGFVTLQTINHTLVWWTLPGFLGFRIFLWPIGHLQSWIWNIYIYM